jgi:hypothetical protein
MSLWLWKSGILYVNRSKKGHKGRLDIWRTVCLREDVHLEQAMVEMGMIHLFDLKKLLIGKVGTCMTEIERIKEV